MPRAKNGRKVRARGRGNGAARSSGDRVLAPGAAQVPKAWGGGNAGKRGGAMSLGGFNALSPVHMSLPRPIAPYTTIKLTATINSSRKFHMFAAFKIHDTSLNEEKMWARTVSISDADATLPVNAPNNALNWTLPMQGLGDAATVVPSKLSVQVMNPTALQTASGMLYIGRSSTQLDLAGRTETWHDMAHNLISFQQPRLCAAAKLSLKGVQIDALPTDMNDLSEFMRVGGNGDSGPFTWDAAGTSGAYMPVGFTPIWVYNPSAENLQYQVTVEYRVRFDLTNPASSSHSYHPPTPLSVWDAAMRAANTVGHGVRDIADVVANAGHAYRAIGRARQAAIMVD